MNDEIHRALRAAQKLIFHMNLDLIALARGRNLSSVPGFEGEYFPTVLGALASQLDRAPNPPRD